MKNLALMTIMIALTSMNAYSATAKSTSKGATPAAEKNNDISFTNAVPGQPDTDGCGLGWQILPKKTMVGTCVRGTTNAFIPPSFGMTSGTLGCAKHPIAKNETDAVKFAVNNTDQISIEMAKGNGEYLLGFARSMGCSDAVFSNFGQMTQDKFETISTGNGFDLYDSVKTQVKANPVLANNCRV